MDRLLEVYFLPPLAIARVGGSAKPLEAFAWEPDRTIHGAHRTVIKPAVSFEVSPAGTLRPYRPHAIQFRDDDLLRPVAPFFELWAKVEDDDDGRDYDVPVTPALLESLGGSIEGVDYSVTVANRKAQRRTGSAACAFVARVEVNASDTEKKPLRAFSPRRPGEVPLVAPERPIPLGHFQAIKPTPARTMDVDLSVLRVRFTPATGAVYAPPETTVGPASPLPPGGQLPPATLGGRLHEIVPPENRILNPGTPWSTYVMDADDQFDPQPSDSYDGANVGDNHSWGVVDDTCDGVIEAQVVVNGKRFIATARIFSSCPDYAPDRRPFYSFADELADRDLPPVADADLEHEIAELFVRVFETASMVNLDATRDHALLENSGKPTNWPGTPKVDDKTMTKEDGPYADLSKDLAKPGAGVQLPYAELAKRAHAPLTDVETLLDFLTSRKDHVQRLMRPPFGRFQQLDAGLTPAMNEAFRDPRVRRDVMQDMRMPPYMRDSDETPLSMTYRQYQALMALLDKLAPGRAVTAKAADGKTARPQTPVRRRIAQLAERLSKLPRKP